MTRTADASDIGGNYIFQLNRIRRASVLRLVRNSEANLLRRTKIAPKHLHQALVGKNVTVQPAAGEEVSIEETLDPLLGCNGWFVALRSGVRGVSFTTLRPDLACPRRSSAPIRETSFP